jgi:hypothetical protein
MSLCNIDIYPADENVSFKAEANFCSFKYSLHGIIHLQSVDSERKVKKSPLRERKRENESCEYFLDE